MACLLGNHGFKILRFSPEKGKLLRAQSIILLLKCEAGAYHFPFFYVNLELMLRIFQFILAFITALGFILLFKVSTVEAVSANKIGMDSVNLQIEDEKINGAGILLRVTIEGIDIKDNNFKYIKTYTNLGRCGLNGWGDPCIEGRELPDGKDDSGQDPPALKAGVSYKVSYEVKHYPGYEDPTGQLRCRNGNCGPVWNKQIGQSIPQADYLWIPEPLQSPIITIDNPELYPPEAEIGDPNQGYIPSPSKAKISLDYHYVDPRYLYQIRISRNNGKYSKTSNFYVKPQLDGCVFPTTPTGYPAQNDLKIQCLQTANIVNDIFFVSSWNDFPSSDRDLNYEINVAVVQKDDWQRVLARTSGTLLVKSAKSKAPTLEITLDPTGFPVDQPPKNLKIKVNGTIPQKKYKFTINTSTTSQGNSTIVYKDVEAQTETLEVQFDPSKGCAETFCFKNPGSFSIRVEDQNDSASFGSAVLKVEESDTGKALDQLLGNSQGNKDYCKPSNDPDGPNCTSGAGQSCGSLSNPGISTAIGCIHTKPAELVKDIMTFLLGSGGGVAFLMMVFGAFQMMTSSGNPETLNAGRSRLTSAVIGLLFIIFAVLFLQIIGVDILNLPGFER